MSIQGTELKYYQSILVNDTGSNGGVMSTNEITDNVKNNLWPDAAQGERVAGSTKYRKVFVKVANDDDLTLYTSRVFVETPTPGQDRVTIFPGTQTNTQVDLTGNERLYGTGPLNANIGAGAGSLAVVVENGADVVFQDGDLIRISDKTSVNDPDHNEEFLRLATSDAVAWNGNIATLTLASGVTTTNAFQASATRVASCIEPGDIKASFDTWSESSISGTYNEATYPPVLDNIGSVEETWTLTFTSATAFSCSGNRIGSVGSGTTSANFAPSNSTYSKPYFTLAATGWGGSWATGETIVFKTHPAAVAVWEKRIVPAGTASHTNNQVIIAVSGESD